MLLFSGLATDQIQIVNSRRLEDVLSSKKLVFDKIDGSLAEHKTIRDELFAISGQRGKYPQCFIKSVDGYKFIGFWEELQSLIDCDSLPPDVISANPTIPTFSKVTTIFQ